MNAEVTTRTFPSPLYLMVTLIIFALTILFSTLSLYQAYPALAVGVTYDLALTSPLFYYLAIRKTRIPKLTVLAVAGVGIALATFLLPPAQQGHLSFITYYVAPAVEIFVLGFVGFKVWNLVRTIRRKRHEIADVHLLLKEVAEGLIGKSVLAGAASFELSILYYAVIRWRRPKLSEDSFSYHKKRGAGAIFAVSVFLLLAETIVFHILISQWSTVAAWLITITTLYLLFLLTAQYKSTYFRPIEISDDVLKIRCGLFCDADIPVDEIVEIEEIHAGNLAEDVHQAAFLKGFESVNLLITTKNERTAIGPYGYKSTYQKIAFFVDEKEQLVERLKNYDG